MKRLVEERIDRRDLLDLAAVHHGHAVARFRDDCQVVRDQQDGSARAAPLHLHHQVENLRLDRDVERRRRLVGDQQRRVAARARSRSSRAAAGRRRSDAGTASFASPGSGMPTSAEDLDRAPVRLLLRRLSCAWMTSVTCIPIVKTGLSEVIGSWKTMLISLPRILRISSQRQLQQVAAPDRGFLRRRCGRADPE